MAAYEVFSQRAEASSITFGGGEFKTRETSELSGYGVRALEGGRLGFAYCQEEGRLEATKEKAKRLSRFSPKSGFSFSPASAFSMPDIEDPSLDPADYRALKELLDELRGGAESFGARTKAVIAAHRSSTALHNTEGFSGEYAETGFSAYAECMHGDGLGMAHLMSNRLADVHEVGLKAAGMAKDMQGAKKPEKGRYTVVFQIEALEGLLDTLLPSFSGDWKRRGITKVAEKTFSEGFTLCEDGLAPGTSARPFDDEGTPSGKRFLVKEGRPIAFLYDRETAALEGIEASGSCSRDSFDDNPSIGSSNIVVSPGDWKDLGEIGRHIELHYAHGSHTANLTSGDIGLEVTSAFQVEGDKRVPLKGFMVSGNVFDMFAGIEAIESKSRTHGGLIAPRIAFKDVQIVS